METVEPRSFKLYLIITWLGVCGILVGLMTLFQGHWCVRSRSVGGLRPGNHIGMCEKHKYIGMCQKHKLQIVDFLKESFPVLFKQCIVATYIQKTMHAQYLCLTLVYTRERIDMPFLVFLSECELFKCSCCFGLNRCMKHPHT